MRLIPFLLVAMWALAACPRPFEPGRTTVPAGGSREATARFETARARFADAAKDAEPEFQAIVHDYPDDPIAPYAVLYAGMAAHRKGDDAAAAVELARLVDDPKTPEEIRSRARFWLGIAQSALGKGAEARALLEPFIGKVEGEEQGELTAALANATAATGDTSAALRYYDAFFAQARPAEKAYIATRVAALAAAVPVSELAGLYEHSDKGGPAAAFLGRRLAAELRAKGEPEPARAILSETTTARTAVGLAEDDSTASGPVDANVVGAILPLSGKRRLVGEAAARGLAVAAGSFDRGAGAGIANDGVPRPFTATIEDAGEGKGRAARAVEALTTAGAIAVVGPVDRDAVEEAARRAETLGIPLVALDVAEAGGGSPYLFRAVLSVEARARQLAAHAAGRGLKRIAILAPELPYGTRAAAAFAKEFEAKGGRIVASEKYKKDATSFVEPVGRIAKSELDGLFVPDTAARLELIAPQLAVANLLVQPRGAKKPKRGRAIALLATAEAVTPKFLRGSGRYTQGAVLAPGFYPDDLDPRIGAFVTRFRVAYGEDPGWLDAYAYDAALLVRAAVEGGAENRAAVAAALARATVAGVTGDLGFDASHGRKDGGVLYTVVAEGTGFGIRALRK